MTTKICAKCQRAFLIWQTIEGKKHNLCNRRFCLSCSPFKKHNTRDITKPQADYIHSRRYHLLSPEQKRLFNARSHESTKQRRINKKKQLVKHFGGKCVKCGYDRNFGALQFHHQNPKEKEFTLSNRDLGAKSWADILQEAHKCLLLCANCHAELHHPHLHKSP
jgi:hypothetical protein